MKDKPSNLYNWTKDKGINPFDYGLEYPKYSVEPFAISYLEEATYKEFSEALVQKDIRVSIQQEMRDLIFVQSVQATNLIKPILVVTEEGEWIQDPIEMEEIVEHLFDVKEPVQVLLDYPLEQQLLLSIPPLNVQYRKLEEKTFPLGYICWQIVLAYGYIFKEEFKKAGVWGHGLSDLQLTDLLIYEGNKVVLDISS